MISKEMLKKAAAEADQAIRDSLPAPAECEHVSEKNAPNFSESKTSRDLQTAQICSLLCSCGGSRQRYMADSGCRSASCFFCMGTGAVRVFC